MYTSKEIFKNADFAATLPLKVLSLHLLSIALRNSLTGEEKSAYFILQFTDPP